MKIGKKQNKQLLSAVKDKGLDYVIETGEAAFMDLN